MFIIRFLIWNYFFYVVFTLDQPHGDTKYLQIIGQKWEKALETRGPCYRKWLENAQYHCTSRTPILTV